MALGYRRISRWLALALAISASVTVGCHPSAPPRHPVGAPGKWYMVEEGETLGDIARRAGVPEEDLLELNGLHSAAEVQKGRLIFVLDPSPPPPGDPTQNGGGTAAPQPNGQTGSDRQARFRWPVEAPQVTSLFGKRWGRAHEGIDLTAPIGTPVLAAGAGEVVYSGNSVRGYGNMVVLKHDAELMTVYAHNSVLFVKVGERVRVGQRVALSGQSGHATGPHVHFEVRKGQVPRDPLPYLPDLRTVAPWRSQRERTPKS
ncbi:MAG: M23 family metallopeptidase [Myxococcales bacterium]